MGYAIIRTNAISFEFCLPCVCRNTKNTWMAAISLWNWRPSMNFWSRRWVKVGLIVSFLKYFVSLITQTLLHERFWDKLHRSGLHTHIFIYTYTVYVCVWRPDLCIYVYIYVQFLCHASFILNPLIHMTCWQVLTLKQGQWKEESSLLCVNVMTSCVYSLFLQFLLTWACVYLLTSVCLQLTTCKHLLLVLCWLLGCQSFSFFIHSHSDIISILNIQRFEEWNKPILC